MHLVLIGMGHKHKTHEDTQRVLSNPMHFRIIIIKYTGFRLMEKRFEGGHCSLTVKYVDYKEDMQVHCE